MELMDMPDLDAFSSIKNSPKKAVDRIINTIIDKQIIIPPDPMLDMEYLKTQATLYYNYVYANYPVDENGEFDDKTYSILDALRQLMENVAGMIEDAKRQAEAEAAAQQPQGLPEGMSLEASPEMIGVQAAEGNPAGISGQLPPEAAAMLAGGEMM